MTNRITLEKERADTKYPEEDDEVYTENWLEKHDRD